MRLRNRFLLWIRKRQGRPLSPMKPIAAAFAVIILLGTFLLTLPAASRDGLKARFGRQPTDHRQARKVICASGYSWRSTQLYSTISTRL